MIAVDQRFQRRGFGLMLIAESFQRAISVHATVPIKGIYLDAGPGTEAFYTSFGFQPLDSATQNGTTPMFIAIAEVLDAMEKALQVERG
jgi:GNAT superfamily N-acetyltransferase